MKKHRDKKRFLENLAKVPIISFACEQTGIARNTIYTWRKEDLEFKRAMDETLEYGRQDINDLAESKLITAIKNGDYKSTVFWLTHNDPQYISPEWRAKKTEDHKKATSLTDILKNALAARRKKIQE